jgi:hypothetical protein
MADAWAFRKLIARYTLSDRRLASLADPDKWEGREVALRVSLYFAWWQTPDGNDHQSPTISGHQW